ncbi:unnamed protein product, partial [Onchocerca ochengi]
KKETWPQRVRRSQWLALKTLGVDPAGTSIGADLKMDFYRGIETEIWANHKLSMLLMIKMCIAIAENFNIH